MHKQLCSALAVAGLLLGLSAAVAADDRDDRPQNRSRPSVGLMISPLPDNSEQEGVLVRQVAPNSPAAKAGIKKGDVITRVDSREVSDGDTLINVLARHKAGDKLRFHVVRDGQEKDMTVTLGQQSTRDFGEDERGAEKPGGRSTDQRSTAFLGVQTVPIDDLSSRMKKRFGVTGEEGLVVVEVLPDSPAAKSGLRHGDVILSVNSKEISSQEQLRHLIHQAGIGKTLKMEVQRGNDTVDLQAKLAAAPSDLAFSEEPQNALRRFFNRRSGYSDPDQQQMDRLERQIQRLERRVQELEQQLGERKQGSKK